MTTSRRVPRAAALSLVVACLMATTLFAQRGGYVGTYNGNYGNPKYDGRFAFVRLSYPEGYTRQRPHWSHDYPAGEWHFMKILNAISLLNPHLDESLILSVDDPDVMKYPVAYMCEPGYWEMPDAGVQNLRAFLQKGGFMIFDDFRGGDWYYFEAQINRILPGAKFFDLNANAAIFHSFFELKDLDIVPQYYDTGKPIFRGIFEDNDPTKRMLVMINYNTDVSEFWEWSDSGIKPIDENNEAFKLGVNYVMYGLTH